MNSGALLVASRSGESAQGGWSPVGRLERTDVSLSSESQVPLPALERLATYIRCLMQLENTGVWTVSSH